VYGASDERRGFKRLSEKVLHPVTQVQAGVLEKECSEIIRIYFQNKR
jgi:tRNA(adenine34) deaminase